MELLYAFLAGLAAGLVLWVCAMRHAAKKPQGKTARLLSIVKPGGGGGPPPDP